MSARNGITLFFLVVTTTEGSYFVTNPKSAKPALSEVEVVAKKTKEFLCALCVLRDKKD